MTPALVLLALVLLVDPSPAPISSGGPSLPGLPGMPGGPAGAPAWLIYAGYVLAMLGTLGVGGIAVKLLDRRKDRATAQRAEAETDEVLTRVAVTLVEPLRDRLEKTETRLTDAIDRHERDRQVHEQEVVQLRGKVREALVEADAAVAEMYRLRRLVQKWHRSIMDPAATIEWLRQLVGPDEPAI